jgi:hypothetical protein
VVVPPAQPRVAMRSDWPRPLVASCFLAVICVFAYNHNTSLTRLQLEVDRARMPLDQPLERAVEALSESGGAGTAEHGRVLDAKKPNAVVTTLYTDDYIDGVRVLGYSLHKHNVSARLIAMYIPEQVRPRGPPGA